MKIDKAKGVRQAFLMFIPFILGYLTHHLSIGLLISIGTLTHTYAIGGTARSRLRIIVYSTFGLSIAMMLGTLTIQQPIIFGALLLVFTVIPYFVFSSMHVVGPSSTFFIVAFSLSINLPIAPEEALLRGACVFVGGMFATLVIIISNLFTRESAEVKAVKNDFNMLKQLVYNFDDRQAFRNASKTAVQTFSNGDKQLLTSSGTKTREAPEFQRLLLLHTAALGIYSELLELSERNLRPLPQDIKEMVDYIIKRVYSNQHTHRPWKKQLNVDERYNNLVANIFKVDEILNLDHQHVKREVDVRIPIYGRRITQHFTLDSYLFRNALRYLVIVGIAITLALMFNFEKAYWIPLSAHTVLLGSNTINSLERAGSRTIGTIVGVLVLSLILLLHPPLYVAMILLSIAAGFTETFVGANYSFAVIFITIQVILLNGIASQHLNIAIALPRVIDVIVGVAIAIIGLLILGRKTASTMLPYVIADAIRSEAIMFHYLFSRNQSDSLAEDKHRMLRMTVKLNNLSQVYTGANGEINKNKGKIQEYYPTIYGLEELSFMLNRALNNDKRKRIGEDILGDYLVVFENLAKYFESNGRITKIKLPELPQYSYITSALTQIQKNCINAEETKSNRKGEIV
ncbi:FUSC family protein [Staphylococcus sp. SQ8-PEA]|uniref:FUSC family protein n=1 Tax=Staphylococcus marylandisciuri TaxID=2981529 RepID=A0ABT2QMX9_9STAP|nr:FUSC family protein [Staphylococcus marylandisciuri]MCU5745327.1 FUSC family protein [Staphylococcus marylandisciuri]